VILHYAHATSSVKRTNNKRFILIMSSHTHTHTHTRARARACEGVSGNNGNIRIVLTEVLGDGGGNRVCLVFGMLADGLT
jgi:hypothetical protein